MTYYDSDGNFHDAQTSVRQLRWFDHYEMPREGVWHCPATGRGYRVGARAIFGQDSAGNPIVSPKPDRNDKHAATFCTSVDQQGYDRRRGLVEIIVSYGDGNAIMALQRDGIMRGYRRVAGQNAWDDWQLDPSAATEALRFAKHEAVPTHSRWDLVAPMQRSSLRAFVASAVTGKQQRNLWLHGTPGGGKTTALHAVVGEALAQGGKALYLSVPDLVLQTRSGYTLDAIRAQAEAQWSEAGTTALLALDDLTAGVKPNADDLRLRLHDLFDQRDRRKLPTIVGDNLAPEVLLAAGYDARLCSRCTAFQAVQYGSVDHRRAANR